MESSESVWFLADINSQIAVMHYSRDSESRFSLALACWVFAMLHPCLTMAPSNPAALEQQSLILLAEACASRTHH